jgi:sulfate transport system substrate-binding protein
MLNAGKATRRGAGIAALLAVLLTAAVVTGCGGGSDSAGASGGGKLDVVGYSTAFEKTSAGEGVSFSNSFGASGDQSRAVVAGQPASVVHFAQAGDMERLVEEGGLVVADWDKQPYGGIAQDSVVVISVRKGNPKGIQTLDDVLSKDVDVVTPNPFSSGAARWNIMAVYGTLINEGSSPDEALEGVKTLLEKTVAQPGSARDALAAFTQGEGDVLLGYENEAIKAEGEGEDLEYVVPPSTILIETPIAVTKDAPEPAAEDFLKFIWSDEGQEIWAEAGYRPVDPKLVDPKQFPTPKELFKISQFGGWGKVNDEFFDEESGSVAKIEGELGVSTSG